MEKHFYCIIVIVLCLSGCGGSGSINENPAVINESTSPPPAQQRSFFAPVSGDGGYVSLERRLYEMTSNHSSLDIWVGRLAGNLGELSVNYELQDGSISSGINGYTESSGTLVWSTGELGYKKITVSVNNAISAGSEYFHLVLTGASTNFPTSAYKIAGYHFATIRVDDGSLNPDAIYVNNETGSDLNTGTGIVNKRANIQAAITAANNLQVDHIYVEKTNTDYTETVDNGGTSVTGYRLRNSLGSSTSYLRIEGLNKPVINPNFSIEPGGKQVIGFYCLNDSHYWISNFEIKNTINWFQTGCDYTIFDNSVISGARGGDNLGSIRHDHSQYHLVHNCELHHNYDIRPGENSGNVFQDPFISNPIAPRSNINVGDRRESSGNLYIAVQAGQTANTPFNTISGTGTGIVDGTVIWDYLEPAPRYNGVVVYAYQPAIHGFGPGNRVVEYSYIHHTKEGMKQKEPSTVVGVFATEVKNNRFEFTERGAVDYNESGGGNDRGTENAYIYFNTLYKTRSHGGVANAGSMTQSTGFYSFNNTLVESGNGWGLNGITNINIFDNIFSDQSTMWPNRFYLSLDTDRGGTDDITIDYMNYNTLYNVDASVYQFERNGTNEVERFSLTTAQTVFSDFGSSLGNLLMQDIEVDSDTNDPQFTDVINRNYRRLSNPQDGRFGQARGAFFDAHTEVGLLNKN